MILESNSILGFNLYKRTRLYEKRVAIAEETIHCEDIGLYVISQYPNLEYNYVSLDEKTWWRIAHETISLTVLNLLISGTISLYKFEDKKVYANGLKTSKTIGYLFKIEDISTQEDLFTKTILKTINELYAQNSNRIDLSLMLTRAINNYLYKTQGYKYPSKTFIVTLLRAYSKQYDWLKIKSNEKFLGIYRDYKVDINRIYLPRIKMQHETLKNSHEKLLIKSDDYRCFISDLKSNLYNDFVYRKRKTHH